MAVYPEEEQVQLLQLLVVHARLNHTIQRPVVEGDAVPVI
jgi:hypothetical protein